MTWHIARGSAKTGPISEDKMARLIEAGRLRPTDQVWRAGMPEWKPAGKVEGLFAPPNSFASSAPPLYTAQATGTDRSLGGYLLSHWQGRFSLAKSFWVNGVVVGLLFHIVFWILIGIGGAIAPVFGGLTLLAYILLALALTVWQPVGLYRSAISYIRKPERTSNFWAHVSLIYATTTTLMLPVFAVAIIGGVSALGTNADATFNAVSAEMYEYD
ncbi:DUF4339 domain-containing protein [Henriciella aquimarina]|uniref:DUF4339 domain-containing protein n=1 Tax=Henriciella aquimarina TaxID=545261 RepID=UPI0009FF7B20|nr:DUF4339 domain-containing protein [Henriciella aquimarina]